MSWPPGAPAVLHVDMDAFYASVETAYRPSLAGRPVVVGGDPRHGRGVVMSASYEARAFGLRSAMPITQAFRLCPDAAYLPPRSDRYGRASRRVMDALRALGATVEERGWDEAYVDGSPLMDDGPEDAARRVQDAVREATGLSCSVGLAATRAVAKIASDHRKPRGLVVVPPAETAAFLAPLPVRRLPGIGPKTSARLADVGIGTLGDLAAADLSLLGPVLGSAASGYREEARGRGAEHVDGGRHRPRSVGEEWTLEEDTADAEVLREAVRRMASGIGESLRASRLLFRTLTLKLRLSDFRTFTRSTSLPSYAADGPTLRERAGRLLDASWSRGEPVRLLGVRVSNLVEARGQQVLAVS